MHQWKRDWSSVLYFCLIFTYIWERRFGTDLGLEKQAAMVGRITFHFNGGNLHFQPSQSQQCTPSMKFSDCWSLSLFSTFGRLWKHNIIKTYLAVQRELPEIVTWSAVWPGKTAILMPVLSLNQKILWNKIKNNNIEKIKQNKFDACLVIACKQTHIGAQACTANPLHQTPSYRIALLFNAWVHDLNVSLLAG